ncbi:MAG: hypothetical protein KAR20_23435 [Candidatus Heimdallarchaeota archaeon]|nr:hypothetical protein [Candidatus Heimdallarchaeota archaeon]
MTDKILWLENDPVKMRYQKKELEEHGFYVEMLKTFTDVEAALQSDKFCLVILDVLIMPTDKEVEKNKYPGTEMRFGTRGGLVFYRLMKEINLLDPSRVVVFTVLNEPEIHKEFIDNGLPVDNFLAKEVYPYAHKFVYKIKEIVAKQP